MSQIKTGLEIRELLDDLGDLEAKLSDENLELSDDDLRGIILALGKVQANAIERLIHRTPAGLDRIMVLKNIKNVLDKVYDKISWKS